MTNGTSLNRPPRGQHMRERLQTAFLGVNERIWWRLPARVREYRVIRGYGAWLHTLVCRRADREMYLGTVFLRNRPALELMRRLVANQEPDSQLKIAVLGCSIGVEVYSILWKIRSSRPDLDVVVQAVDISPEVLEVAERGVYSPEASRMVDSSIFQGLSETERRDIFDWESEEGRVKAWLRDGVTWQLGDAGDPDLVAELGPQDLVVASNFLCHMPPASAQSCLRNLSGLMTPGGYLFVTGVDLDVRTNIARELGWEPIPELRAEIHDGDSLVRSDWPWRWWGLEPLNRRRRGWELRYSAVFRLDAQAAPPIRKFSASSSVPSV